MGVDWEAASNFIVFPTWDYVALSHCFEVYMQVDIWKWHIYLFYAYPYMIQPVNSVCWMTIYRKLLQTTEFIAHLNLNLHWKMESDFYGQWTYFSFLLFLSASWLKKALLDLIYNRHYGMSVWEMSSFYCVLYQILTISCEAIYSSHSTHY